MTTKRATTGVHLAEENSWNPNSVLGVGSQAFIFVAGCTGIRVGARILALMSAPCHREIGGRFTREVRRVLWFTIAYLGAATPYSLVTGNYEFVLYIAVIIVIIPLLATVHRRVGLPTAILWAFSGWGVAHLLGGLLTVPAGWPVAGENPVLYSLWLVDGRLKFDQVVHAYGFGITTWLCWHVMDRSIAGATGDPSKPTRPTFGLLVLAVASGMGFGALNEVIEFAATLLVPKTNVGGYRNTGWDLVANLLGGVVAALLIRRFGRYAKAKRRAAKPTKAMPDRESAAGRDERG